MKSRFRVFRNAVWATLLLLFVPLLTLEASAAERVRQMVDLSQYRRDSRIEVRQEGHRLRLTWPTDSGRAGTLLLDLRADQPLIESVGTADAQGRAPKTIAANLNPVTVLTVGSRDLTRPEGWMIFFDKTYTRPYQTYAATLRKDRVRVISDHERCTVRVGELTAGPFKGALEITVYADCRLIRFDSVVRTEEDGKALLYDAGMSSTAPSWKTMTWHDTGDMPASEAVAVTKPAMPLAVFSRTVVAQGENGSLALFPPPHQYFYPLDFVTNLGFAWRGANYRDKVPGYGFGIRQPLEGDRRWVPWFNAPPRVDHHLAFYCVVAEGDGENALTLVRKFTHGDAFKPLPGYHTFTSHYHIEHTLGFVRRQKEQKTTGVPKGDEVPGFVTAFKRKGVEIVHLAELHEGNTPAMADAQRLPLLRTLYDECARLSDNSLLLLPGEEPDVHLGGHWISLFPHPVYWVLNRKKEIPFVEQVSGYGKVYHVGSPDDVLRLMREENGLMWTAHARIKGSRGFPDNYWNTDFFRADPFLGAAWKSLPADLSLPRLGTRVFDLMDDMANAGLHKTIIGEVDAFAVQPDYELYGPMNINYLKLDKVPRYADGWQPVLDTLHAGKLFVTTGEVLLPSFTVGGKESGETLTPSNPAQVILEAEMEWTFPLAYAEVISGDGIKVYRQRIALTDTPAFGKRKLHVPVNLTNRKWVRLEVWDTAVNGAFTNPVWLK